MEQHIQPTHRGRDFLHEKQVLIRLPVIGPDEVAEDTAEAAADDAPNGRRNPGLMNIV